MLYCPIEKLSACVRLCNNFPCSQMIRFCRGWWVTKLRIVLSQHNVVVSVGRCQLKVFFRTLVGSKKSDCFDQSHAIITKHKCLLYFAPHFWFFLGWIAPPTRIMLSCYGLATKLAVVVNRFVFVKYWLPLKKKMFKHGIRGTVKKHHNIDWDESTILKYEENDQKRMFYEAYHIKSTNHTHA